MEQLSFEDFIAQLNSSASGEERRVKVSFTITGTQVIDTNLALTNEESALACKLALQEILLDQLEVDADWTHDTHVEVNVVVTDEPVTV